MIWDTHAHLDDRQFKTDRDTVLQRAFEAGVTTIVNIGHTESTSREALELAIKYPSLYATIGIHPHDAKDCNEQTWVLLERLAQSPKVVAWGEIGLDYYRDLSPRDVQRQVFIQQLKLAKEAGLPIIIHNRDAHADVFKIIKENPSGTSGVFHSYSGSWEMAKGLLKLGFYLSFSGPITYKNARHTVEVAAKMPEDRFVVETDCPYLTPEPYRGKRNEPAFVREVVSKIAEIRGITFEKAAQLSTENAKKLFGVE